MIPVWSAIIPFFFGSAIGSFLNVVVWRVPRHESIAYPPSHCPKCNHRLGVLDLFPLLSFLLLRCRCRYCGAKISWRYFVVEFITGALWALLWFKFIIPAPASVWATPFPYLWQYLCYSAFISILIPIFLIDLEWFEIPDSLNAALLITGLLNAGFAPGLPTAWAFSEFGETTLLNSFIGAQVGALVWIFVAVGGRLMFRKDALGHGDIKMARGIGALVLMPGVLFCSITGVVLGITIGVPGLLLMNRKQSQEQEPVFDDEPDSKPETISSLLAYSLLYLLWLDVLLLFLPRRMQFNFYYWLSNITGDLPEGLDKEKAYNLATGVVDDDFKPSATTIPFGPALVGGALVAIFFSEWLVELWKMYLNYAGFGLE